MSELTRILHATSQGDTNAASKLLPLVYDELRQLAARKMAQESGTQTLQPTALVHEAWLRLGGDEQPTWQNRTHFFCAAAEAMRRILIDRARSKQARRHGGGQERVDVDEVEIAAPCRDDEMLAINEALDRFAQHAPQKAELVKLRYFAGMGLKEAGQVLGISEATAVRWWTYSKTWLYQAIRDSGGPTTGLRSRQKMPPVNRSQSGAGSPPMRVRDFTPADLAACLAVFDSNMSKFFVPAEREAFSSFLAALPGPYLVMEDEAGTVVACGGYAVAPGTTTADLCWGMVLRERHRSGLGRQLLLARLERIRADGVAREVILNTSQHTQGFYERMGFVVERVQPGRYAPGLARCDLRLHLSSQTDSVPHGGVPPAGQSKQTTGFTAA